MTIEIEERLRAYSATVDRAIENNRIMRSSIVDDLESKQSGASSRLRSGSARRHRRGLAVACASVVLLMTIVVAVVATLREDNHQLLTATPSPESDGTTFALFGHPSAALFWSVLVDTSTISRSQVGSMVSGPAGFVATGIGLEAGVNVGRVWYSSNGIVWEEPDLEQFGLLAVSIVSATEDAYYLLAGPNPDRSAPGGLAIYRSVDGREWNRIGNSPVSSLAAAGAVLLGTATTNITDGANGIITADQQLLSSRDGRTWRPATFDETPSAQTVFDVVGITGSAGRYFLRGLGNAYPGDQRIWTSTDGAAWQTVPESPDDGLLTATDQGLLLAHTTVADDCLTTPEGVATPETLARSTDQLWSCAGVATFSYLPIGGAWTKLSPAGVPASPIWSRPVAVAGTLVLPVIRSGHLTIVESTDAIDWQPSDVDLNLLPDGPAAAGSPQQPMAVASSTSVLIATPAAGGFGTTLVLGVASNTG